MAWYVVRTISGQERRVAGDVSAIGVVGYAPYYEQRLVLRGKKVQRWRPLVPGYAFMETDRVTDFLRAVLDCKGVISVIRSAGSDEPIAVAAESIRMLKLAEAEANKVKLFEPNGKVRIVDGIMAGRVAFVLRLDSGGRLLLREDEGNARPFSISRASVESLPEVTTGNTGPLDRDIKLARA